MNSLFEKCKKIIRTGTIKDTGIVLIGQILSTIFSAIFFFLIARFLGPAKLGIYAVITAVVTILSDTVDIAINSSIIKFISSPQKESFLKFAFFLKIILGLFFIAFLFLFSEVISLILRQNISLFLRVSSLWIFLTFLIRFPKSIFQAERKFINDVTIDVQMSLLRLVIVLALILGNRLTIMTILWVQIACIFVIFLIWMKKISLHFLRAPIPGEVKKKFFSFHGWLSIGFILAAIHSRLDNFFLMRFSGPTMVGFYQAGYRFFLPVSQFSSVLSTVFAPRFSSFKDAKETKNYLKKAIMLSFFLSCLLFLFIFLAPSLVNIFYGPSYKQAILPTQILTLGFVAFVFGVPFISFLLYHKGQTKFFAFLNLLQFSLIILFDLFFIPKYKATGAAIASSLTFIMVYSLAAYQALRK